MTARVKLRMVVMFVCLFVALIVFDFRTLSEYVVQGSPLYACVDLNKLTARVGHLETYNKTM